MCRRLLVFETTYYTNIGIEGVDKLLLLDPAAAEGVQAAGPPVVLSSRQQRKKGQKSRSPEVQQKYFLLDRVIIYK